ncbi:MAG: pirin-like C-terminal cupin domain-containing protein, partial [Myxococcota bacterium]|nr:pirin-like C-terminal cupin domain-containing protein [Myxococcota bacterium]
DGHYGPGDRLVPEGSLVAFAREEGGLTLMATDQPLEVLVLAAEPLGEPVARYGPFVMNTRDELLEAVRDYQTGHFGIIAPRSR